MDSSESSDPAGCPRALPVTECPAHTLDPAATVAEGLQFGMMQETVGRQHIPFRARRDYYSRAA